MVSLSTLRRALPDFPRRRYHVFAGTNTPAEWRVAARALVRGEPADGSALLGYEEAFARAAGCRHAFAFGAGRMALYALLEALALQPGDEVVLPGFTCVAVPHALLYRGLTPVYADIEPRTFNLDPADVEARITPRTRAILAQHTFGVSADVARLRAIAQRRGVLLLEDAAHSLGARQDGVPHGALGHAAFFSTDHTKVINTHLGGMVSTNDDVLAQKLAELQARTPFLRAALVRRTLFAFVAEGLLGAPPALWVGRPVLAALRRLGLTFDWSRESAHARPDAHPYPCRLSTSQSALGTMQLAALEANLAHRRTIARWCEARLHWYGALGGAFDQQAWLRYSFLVHDRAAFERRCGARFALGTWFTSPIFGKPERTEEVGYRPGTCPVAERVARHIVNLPTHPRIPLAALEELWERHGAEIRAALLRPEDLRAPSAD